MTDVKEKLEEYLMSFPISKEPMSFEEIISDAFIAGYKCCEKYNSVNLHQNEKK